MWALKEVGQRIPNHTEIEVISSGQQHSGVTAIYNNVFYVFWANREELEAPKHKVMTKRGKH